VVPHVEEVDLAQHVDVSGHRRGITKPQGDQHAPLRVELAGLPDFMREAMKSEAQERKLDGHVITLSRSSVEPFLQFSKRRDLREKIFRAFAMRGDNGGATDNKAIIAEMVRLRAERARLLGFPDFAHYRLDDAMAKTPAAVRELLDRVWPLARGRAAADREALQALMAAVCKTYAAQVEAGEQVLPLPQRGGATATEVMVTASGLLKAANLAVFELGMWQSWTGR